MDVVETNLVVIGSGPGGYAAAFRASDLGVETVLVERYEKLGGVCLNVGCIPSKAYLNVAEGLHEAKSLEERGVQLEVANKDIKAVLAMKERLVEKLSGGIQHLAKKRKVKTIQGMAQFVDANTLRVDQDGQELMIKFKHAIIATGSEPNRLPFLPEDPRIFDSTGALALERTQGHLVIIGGGIIGCEMATIYQAMGCQVTVLEIGTQIMTGAEPSQAAVCQKAMEKEGVVFKFKVKIKGVDSQSEGLTVTLEDEVIACDQILYCVGRKPSGQYMAPENAGVEVDDKGFIPVDEYMRTNREHIYCVGDAAKVDQDHQMLAHRATAHGHIAAEIIAGHNIRYDIRCIPSVAYTDPELAWVGVTGEAAKGLKVGKFPWMASGRSLATGQGVGETKVYADPETERILGASIVGRHAGEIIGVFCLAIEMGATLTDLALTVMPHPTLVETTMLACEAALGTITDL